MVDMFYANLKEAKSLACQEGNDDQLGAINLMRLGHLHSIRDFSKL